MLGDPLGQRVVDRLRLADRRRGVALALDPRLEQRQHREVDTDLVHGVETQRVDLWQPFGCLAADRRRRPATLGAPHIGEPLDEEMLIERNLPGHVSLPPAASTMACPVDFNAGFANPRPASGGLRR